MTDALSTLLLATAVFVGGHFVLASLPVRKILIGKIGENGHRGVFSLFSAGTMVWMIFAYRDAMEDNRFYWFEPSLAMIPAVTMPLVCILLVCTFTTKSPTAVGGEKMLPDLTGPTGILTVTRHPMLVAFALWGISHIPANGDAASIILFGGMAVLSIVGMSHIDHRRQVTLGSDWGPIALTTSAFPFLAAVQGRTKVDWKGIGHIRVAGGLVLYGALVYAHGWITGVPIAH